VPYLTLVREGEVVEMRKLAGSLVIGRAAECGWTVQNPLLSRRHLRFEPRQNGWQVIDLGSTNGSWMDGARLTSERLSDGDVIQAGDFELIFTETPFVSVADLIGTHAGGAEDQAAEAQETSQPIIETAALPEIGAEDQTETGPEAKSDSGTLLTPIRSAGEPAVSSSRFHGLAGKIRNQPQFKIILPIGLAAGLAIVSLAWFGGPGGRSAHANKPSADGPPLWRPGASQAEIRRALADVPV
jgi:hypothetical protein